MHEHMRNLLNAYMDGELHGTRHQEMERHLAECEACRKELRELRGVSELLRAAPEPEFLPASRFVSNLTLQLSRRERRNETTNRIAFAWWLAPAGLWVAWIFIRTVFALTDVATVAQLSGLLGQAPHLLRSDQATLWFSAAAGLFGGQVVAGQATLATLNTLSVFGENLLEGFLWQALIATLYLGWLAAMWLRQNPGRLSVENTPR